MTTPGPESLTLRLNHQSTRAVVAQLSGEAGQPQEALLDRFAAELGARAEPLLVLDLSQLTFISSVGLRTLMSVRHRQRAAHHAIALAAVPEQILSVLRRCKLDAQFSIYATPAEALAAEGSRS